MRACRECGETKDKDEYYKNSNNPTGYQVICKICDNEKSRVRKLNKRKENWDRLMEDLGGQKCSICSFTDEYRGCFDLHHKNMKEKEVGVSTLLAGHYSKVKEEADKCILVCANCHRKLHEGGNHRQNKESI